MPNSKVEFGLQVANLEFARYRDVAQEAEALGYDLITCPDHIVHERPGGRYDPAALAYDAFLVTAAMAEATKKIRVGHLVLCNLFRHPAITAQALMSLDRLSNGRAIAGLGTGWTTTEFRMTGIPFPEIAPRLRMLDEALTCLRSLWTNEKTTFQGEFYRFEEAILWPKPVQSPHPPILLGGSGKGLLRIAAKHAEAVNIISDVGKAGQITLDGIVKLTDDAFRAKVRFVRDEAKRHGRDPRSVRMSNAIFTVAIVDSKADGDAIAENMGAMFGGSAAAARHSPMSLIGTPEECVTELRRRIRDWEIEQFVFSGGPENFLRRLAEEVLRHVR